MRKELERRAKRGKPTPDNTDIKLTKAFHTAMSHLKSDRARQLSLHCVASRACTATFMTSSLRSWMRRNSAAPRSAKRRRSTLHEGHAHEPERESF